MGAIFNQLGLTYMRFKKVRLVKILAIFTTFIQLKKIQTFLSSNKVAYLKELGLLDIDVLM